MSPPRNPPYILIFPERPTRKNSDAERSGAKKGVSVTVQTASPPVILPSVILTPTPLVTQHLRPSPPAAQESLDSRWDDRETQGPGNSDRARRVDAMSNYLSSEEGSRPSTAGKIPEVEVKASLPKVPKKKPVVRVVKAPPPRPEWNGYINFVPPTFIPKLRSDRSQEERRSIPVTIRRPRKLLPLAGKPIIKKVPISVPPHLKFGTGFYVAKSKGSVAVKQPKPTLPETPVSITSSYGSSNFSSDVSSVTATSSEFSTDVSVSSASATSTYSWTGSSSSNESQPSIIFSPRSSLLHRMI